MALRADRRRGEDPARGRAERHHRRAHHGSPGARGAQRLAPLLSPVRPQPGRGGQTGRGGRRRKPPGNHRLDRQAAGRQDDEVRRRGPRRARELAAALDHLARQRPDVERQGARVLPQALSRHPYQQRRPGNRQGFGQGGGLARPGAGRETRPGGRHQLPHGYLGALFGHRPADRHLVRKGRPQHHRHALLHPPAAGGGSPLLGGEERLGHLQGVGQKDQRTGRGAPAGSGARHRRRAAAARHSGRDGPAGDEGLEQGGVRANPRQDHARAGGGRARLQKSLQPLHLSGSQGPGRDRRPRPHLAGRGLLRRDGRQRQGGGVGRPALSDPAARRRTRPR